MARISSWSVYWGRNFNVAARKPWRYLFPITMHIYLTIQVFILTSVIFLSFIGLRKRSLLRINVTILPARSPTDLKLPAVSMISSELEALLSGSPMPVYCSPFFSPPLGGFLVCFGFLLFFRGRAKTKKFGGKKPKKPG